MRARRRLNQAWTRGSCRGTGWRGSRAGPGRGSAPGTRFDTSRPGPSLAQALDAAAGHGHKDLDDDGDDAARVAVMRRALDRGLSAAEVAHVALHEPSRPDHGVLGDATARLLAAIRGYDEAEMHAILDESLEAFGIEAVLRDLILATLHRVGAEWAAGTLDVSQEHFASHLIRGRLLSLARLWGRGGGPLALLACAPGEAHDISLLAFGLVLRSHGWRVLFLGADTPIDTVIDAARDTRPSAAVFRQLRRRAARGAVRRTRRARRHRAADAERAGRSGRPLLAAGRAAPAR